MASQGAPPITLPKPQAAWRVAVCTVTFPLCIAAIITAAAGLFVLTGKTADLHEVLEAN